MRQSFKMLGFGPAAGGIAGIPTRAQLITASQQPHSSATRKAGLESSDLAVNFGKGLLLTKAQFSHLKMQVTAM